MIAQFGWIISFLVIWLLVVVVLLTTIVVLDFLVIGRHGRLDWIADLFRREVKK